jgi:glycosyltransferase involved in cell wall biosynthesis
VPRQTPVADVQTTNRVAEVWAKDFDGLVCYFYSYTAFAAALARIRGKRVIATGGGEQLFRSLAPNFRVYATRLILFWLSLLFVNRILATSSADYHRMRELAWFRRSAVELSFHGADAADRVDRADFLVPRAEGSMVTICGMDTLKNIRRKGLLRAIDLLADMKTSIPGARLTIIGRTTCAQIVRDYAEKIGCLDALDLVGYVSEEQKITLLRSARYYVQLSDYEGFGIGALEALACGCQVVHSNVGGLRDTVAGYGIVADLDRVIKLDPTVAYDVGDWTCFERHMAQFTVSIRANAILSALRLA